MQNLTKVRMQCSLRSSDLLSAEHKSTLHTMILESYFAGFSLNTPIEILCEQLVKDEEHRLGKCRYLFVFLVRILSLCAVGLLARIALIQYFDLKLGSAIDFLLLTSAFVLVFIFYVFLDRYYPKSWFWNEEPSKEAEDWMRALFSGKISTSSPVHAVWEKMEIQERVYGISLASTKSLLLLSWRSQKNVHTQETLRSFEDYLPVAEFICLGISSGFILLGPILQILES